MALNISRPETAADDLDLGEKGRRDGVPLSLDRRLFMQLLVYGNCRDSRAIVEALARSELDTVLYEDLNDPQGIAVLTMAETPDLYVTTLRALLNEAPFHDLVAKPEYTMFGRTYTLGYEDDLEESLIGRPRRRALDPALPWAIWYPLRRAGDFEQLPAEEQRTILMEHGGIGRAFGRAGYGYDLRLACYGLDKNDNDFVVGLVGKELYPLSVIVQRMRKTKQTSLYIERLGPFFIGKALWKREARPE
jgi:chlorite dismutase